MTNEERDLIARFMARVGGMGGGGFGSSVPATRPNLPPVDPEADRFIAEQMQTYPEARYRVTQMAVVQEAALTEAQNRIRRLEWELQQAQAAAQAPRGGGLFGGLFGGGRPRPGPGGPGYGQPGYGGAPGYAQGGYGGPPPQPQYPPNYQPGMFRQGGSGFLGSALTTAAGVAGGMVVGNALMDMFDGGRGGGAMMDNVGDAGGGFAGGDPFGGAGTGGADPWGGGGGDAGGGDPWGGGGGGDSGGGGDPWGGGDAGGGGWDDGGGSDGGLF